MERVEITELENGWFKVEAFIGETVAGSGEFMHRKDAEDAGAWLIEEYTSRFLTPSEEETNAS